MALKNIQPQSLKNETDSSRVLRSAGMMGVATLISRVCGLVREQVFAVLFGASAATDAFNIAFRIPNLFRDLFAEGAMSSAFVPTFIRVKTERGDRDAWRLAGLVFRVLSWGVGILTVIGIVFAPSIVGLYASAYKLIPGKFELTVTLTREMFPFFPLVVLAAAYMGVLNACQAFFMPAFASALFNVVSIAVGVVLSFQAHRFGRHPIEGMAIGVVAGGVAQAFSQLPLLYKKGYFWPGRSASDPAWHADPHLRRVLWLMIPGTLGLAATQINILVNSILATSAGTGSVSWLNYAFRLMQFPIGIFGVSFAAATLPLVAKHWVEQKWQAASGSVGSSLRQVIAVNLPASAGLAFLGEPIIRLIFQYGKFTEMDTRSTAGALAAYSIGLVAYSGVKVLAPVFYAMGNTKIPVISSVLSVALNLAFNLALVDRLGFFGLALGTSLTAIVNILFLMTAFRSEIRRKGAHFSPLKISGFTLKVAFISLMMGYTCQKWQEFWFARMEDGVLPRLFQVGTSVLLGGLLILFAGRLLSIQEMVDPVQRIWKKLVSEREE